MSRVRGSCAPPPWLAARAKAAAVRLARDSAPRRGDHRAAARTRRLPRRRLPRRRDGGVSRAPRAIEPGTRPALRVFATRRRAAAPSSGRRHQRRGCAAMGSGSGRAARLAARVGARRRRRRAVTRAVRDERALLRQPRRNVRSSAVNAPRKVLKPDPGSSDSSRGRSVFARLAGSGWVSAGRRGIRRPVEARMIPRRHRARRRAPQPRAAQESPTTPSLRRRVRRVRFRLARRVVLQRDGRFRRYSRRPRRGSLEFARLRDARTHAPARCRRARLGFGAFRSTVGETPSARSIAEPSDGSTKRSARPSQRRASNKTVVCAVLFSE